MTPSSQVYSSSAIANSFLDLAAKDQQHLEPMKLQKLVYIAHGWHLGHGQPLCREPVEAWRWGPVFKELYHAVKKWGMDPIKERLNERTVRNGRLVLVKRPTVKDHGFSERIVSETWLKYGRRYTGPQLSALTHQRGSPWHQVYDGKRNTIIPNALIAAYYRKKIDAARSRAAAS